MSNQGQIAFVTLKFATDNQSICHLFINTYKFSRYGIIRDWKPVRASILKNYMIGLLWVFCILYIV